MKPSAGTTVLRYLLHRAFAANRALTILGVAMVITFFATLVGVFVDHRVITGAPAWLKPAKFAVSVSIYCFTFVWLLGFVENHARLVRLVAYVTVTSFSVEMIAIITQDGRATDIHVAKGLGRGLDEKAIEAVRTWRFRPALGPDGKPAAVRQTIEVTFHLY